MRRIFKGFHPDGKEWVPDGHMGRCDQWSHGRDPCEFSLGGFRDRQVFGVCGVEVLRVRHYNCKGHSPPPSSTSYGECSLLDGDVLAAMCSASSNVRLSTPMLVTGNTAFTLGLDIHLFSNCLESGWDIAETRRTIAALWAAANVPARLQGHAALAHVEASLPCHQTMTCLMAAMLSWLPSYKEDLYYAEEGRVLRFHATYEAIKTLILKNHFKFATCVGTIMGDAPVLNSGVMPSENAAALKALMDPCTIA